MQPGEFSSAVFFLAGEWDRFHRRGLIEALAEQLAPLPVICVDRPIALPKVWRYSGRSPLHRSRRHSELPNVLILKPALAFHEYVAGFIPGGWSINRRLLRRQIERGFQEIGGTGECPLLWFYHPIHAPLVDLFTQATVVYECYDEYNRDSLGRLDAGRLEVEIRFLRRVDLVFATARSLAHLRSQYHPRVHFLPNGVDLRFFASPPAGAPAAGTLLQQIPSPRLGYIGNIYEFLDFELLERVARLRPEWSFVFFGPVPHERLVRTLRACPNVHFPGRIPHAWVPAILDQIDVALAPFQVNGYSIHSNPLKIYEYLAAGKPVVATRLPELIPLEPVIHIVPNTAEGFVAGVEAALQEKDSVEFRRCARTTIERYDWRVIAQEVVQTLRMIHSTTEKNTSRVDLQPQGR